VSALLNNPSINEDGAIALRLSIKGGGCSGMTYSFELAHKVDTEDRVFEHNGTVVLVDPISILHMYGMNIDYTKNLSGEHFVFHNPNATTKCGCGSSFGI